MIKICYDKYNLEHNKVSDGIEIYHNRRREGGMIMEKSMASE